jgi:hypothetical protein
MQSCKEYLYIFAAENAFYHRMQYHGERPTKVWIVEW